MARSPFQVLVLPYRIGATRVQYAIFRRRDSGIWQGIAGGGEDAETPREAARREVYEEGNLPDECPLLELDTRSTVPATCFAESASRGENTYVVPEYYFGMDTLGNEIKLSAEYAEHLWVDVQEAMRALHFDGNMTALWELDRRIDGSGPHEKVP